MGKANLSGPTKLQSCDAQSVCHSSDGLQASKAQASEVTEVGRGGHHA